MGLWVYFLECSDGTFYTGVSNDPEKRFNIHMEGSDKSAYTYSRRPLKLVYAQYFQFNLRAIEFEKRVKKWSKAKKKKLIAEDFAGLIQLSRKKFQ